MDTVSHPIEAGPPPVPSATGASGGYPRNVRLFSWFNFLHGFLPYDPIIILYFTGITGSYSLGLTVFSIELIAASLFEVPTGLISDRVGRKKTLMLGSIASALSILIYALAGSFLVLSIGAFFVGLRKAFFSGNNEALLYESVAANDRQQAFAFHTGRAFAWFQIALGFASLLGGFLGGFSLRWVVWISVVPQVLCVILSFFFRDPPRQWRESTNVFVHLREALSQFRRNRTLRLLSIASILRAGIGETMFRFEPIFFSMFWPVWGVGVARSLSFFLAAAGFWFAGSVIRRLGALRVLVMNRLVNGFIGIIAYAFPSVLSPALISVTSLLYGMGFTSQSTLLHAEFSDAQRATLGSLNAFFGSVFFALFAFAFGFVADHIGPVHSLLAGEILLLPLILIYWRIFAHQKGRTA